MRNAVLFIEMQNEWVSADGRIRPLMTDTEQFLSALGGAEHLLAGAREAGATVLHAGLGFSPGYPELGDTDYGLRGAIPKVGTFPENGSGSRFAPRFVPAEEEFVVKGRIGASAFAGSNLDAYREITVSSGYISPVSRFTCACLRPLGRLTTLATR